MLNKALRGITPAIFKEAETAACFIQFLFKVNNLQCDRYALNEIRSRQMHENPKSNPSKEKDSFNNKQKENALKDIVLLFIILTS